MSHDGRPGQVAAAPPKARPSVVAVRGTPPEPTRSSMLPRVLVAARARGGHVARVVWVGAAAAIVASAAIHLHLWLSGYRAIPTIGWLFLLQVIIGFVLAALLTVVRRVWVGALSFGFVCSTIGGFLLSATNGLFGFHDGWDAPYATSAFGVECASIFLLTTAGALSLLGLRARSAGRRSMVSRLSR